jgi:undecaprenyl-diphosphatase
MSWLHAVVIALLQGAFELFPVSSLGHSVLVPALLNWNEWKAGDPNNATFVAFVVVLHLGTAVALLTFFWRDWVRIIVAVLRSIGRRRVAGDPDAHLGWLILLGSIPTGILGLLFQHKLEEIFDKEVLVAIFLVLNGFMMLFGERLRRRQTVPAHGGIPAHGKTVDDIGVGEGIAVGTAQSLALLPGFSRSGATITGGLLAGLRHADAARYSFLLATPIILAANVLKIPDLFAADANISLAKALVGFLISGVTAYLAVRFLVKYFETDRLDPFGYYCIVFGIFCLVVFGIRAAM